jgi:preprotein translocase subunit SecG
MFAKLQLKIMLKLFVVGAAIFLLTTVALSALTKRKADLETIAEFNDLPSTIGITFTPGDK